MKEHLSGEKLEQFLDDRLSGDDSVGVLIHLDKCAQCRQLVPEEKPPEVLEKLLSETKNEAAQTGSNEARKSAHLPKASWREKVKNLLFSKK